MFFHFWGADYPEFVGSRWECSAVPPSWLKSHRSSGWNWDPDPLAPNRLAAPPKMVISCRYLSATSSLTNWHPRQSHIDRLPWDDAFGSTTPETWSVPLNHKHVQLLVRNDVNIFRDLWSTSLYNHRDEGCGGLPRPGTPTSAEHFGLIVCHVSVLILLVLLAHPPTRSPWSLPWGARRHAALLCI